MFEIHEKLPFEKYRQLPGYHATSLKRALDSALDYRHHELHGWPDSDTLRMGRAGHTACLEPSRFLAEYAQWETEETDADGVVKKRTRRGKVWDEFRAANAGKTILLPEQYETACQIRDAVRDHEEAGPLFKGAGHNELSLRFTHRRAGVDCKTRIDRIAAEMAIVEVKLTHDIDDRVFGNTAARLRYPMQGALQRDAAEACGFGRLPVLIVAIRVAPGKAIDVVVFEVSDDDLAQGQEDYERAIDIVQECRRTQKWPGRASKGRRALVLPQWASPDAAYDAQAVTFSNNEVIQ